MEAQAVRCDSVEWYEFCEGFELAIKEDAKPYKRSVMKVCGHYSSMRSSTVVTTRNTLDRQNIFHQNCVSRKGDSQLLGITADL